MFKLKKISAWLLGAAMAASAAHAADVELLPNGMLEPTTKEMTKEGEFKKAAPWRIGVSFSRLTNTWIVQTVQEMRAEAARNPNISDFIFAEADGKPAKQVADVEDLIAKKIDLLIIIPISEAVTKPLIEKARQKGIPVIIYGAFPGDTLSTVQMGAAGRPFGKVGGEFLCKELKGKGHNLWAFRGPTGSDEEKLRYDGFRKEVDACGLKVTSEVYGDYNYARSKQLCENLVLSGKPVDGIWFAGAEMTRACLDVFRETGKPLVPMTGEGNNGFLRIWKASGVKAVAPLFPPAMGAAWIRASVALLEGKPLYRKYFSAPAPVTQDTLDKFYRPDLSDAYWFPSSLPDDVLRKTFAR